MWNKNWPIIENMKTGFKSQFLIRFCNILKIGFKIKKYNIIASQSDAGKLCIYDIAMTDVRLVLRISKRCRRPMLSIYVSKSYFVEQQWLRRTLHFPVA